MNSVAGSKAPSNEIVAHTGNVALSQGHTRNLAYLAISQSAQIRHQIDANNQGQGALHRKYTGKYTDPLPTPPSWTAMGTGDTNPNLLDFQYNQPFQSTPYGSPWYYTGAFRSIPATPFNGVAGPATKQQSRPDHHLLSHLGPRNDRAASVPSSLPAIPATGAADPANYELRRAGADGLLGNADDAIVSLGSVTYGANTTTLSFAPCRKISIASP